MMLLRALIVVFWASVCFAQTYPAGPIATPGATTATAGRLRGQNAEDLVCWKNSTGLANKCLNVDSLDNFNYAGDAVITQTASQTIYSKTFDAVIFASKINYFSTISPTVSADQTDWAPTGFSTAISVLTTVSGANRTINGLAGGSTGRLIYIKNVGTSNALILKNGTGSAGNKFLLQDDVYLYPNSGASFIYTGSAWRINASEYLASGLDIRKFGADCSGATDSTTVVANALASLNGNELYIPSGCVLRFLGPSAGNAAVSVPSGTRIRCEDNTAGFAPVRKRCVLGTYLNAACSVDGDCPGGGAGACKFDISGASGVFAPTGGSTYTLLKDAGNGSKIEIRNCSIWADQADPFQRCTVGNTPCRKECGNGGAGSTRDGLRCESNSECDGASPICLRTADCSGTCSNAPGMPSTASTAKLNPIDFSRTTAVVLDNVKVVDWFQGDQAIITGGFAKINDVNAAAEIANCTTTLASTPSTSVCLSVAGGLGAYAGNCCYGAGVNIFSTSPLNAQPPTTNALVGISVGKYSTITKSRARGYNYAFSATDVGVDMEDVEAWPWAAFGPGTASGGFNANGVLRRFVARYPRADITVARNNSNADVIEDGIIQGLNGTTPIGIWVQPQTDRVRVANNYVDGSAGTAIKIGLYSSEECIMAGNPHSCCTGTPAPPSTSGGTCNTWYDEITNNIAISNATDSMDYGYKAYAMFDSVFMGNISNGMKTASFRWVGGWGDRFTSNSSVLGGIGCTAPPCNTVKYISPTFKPIHYLMDAATGFTGDGLTGVSATDNFSYGGWRGYEPGLRTWGLANINIIGGRALALGGAWLDLQGAGIHMGGAYYNSSTGPGPVTVCDPSCTGGTVAGGQVCNQDSDCGTCTSTNKCVPDPVIWIGSPNVNGGTSHFGLAKNIIYTGIMGTNNSGQCVGGTGSPNTGQICQTAANTCNGGATCSGTPATCQSGTEKGLRCCTGTSPTCQRPRQPWSDVRFVDITNDGLAITDNEIFTPLNGNFNLIDMSAGTNSVGISGGKIIGNSLYGGPSPSASSAQGIVFPTGTPSITNLIVQDNLFYNLSCGKKLVNWSAAFGAASFPVKWISSKSTTTITSAPTFSSVNDLTIPLDCNSSYKFECELTMQSSATTNGMQVAALFSGTTPQSFAYICRIPQPNVETSPGTDVMLEAQGNVNDDCASTTTGVGATGTNYVAAVRGNIVTPATLGGNLIARARSENNGVAVTVQPGSNCYVQELP